MKNKLKIAIDIAMVCLLPMLMAYSLIGEKFHELIGTLMLVLFIYHHAMNIKWYKSLPKGRYTAHRIFNTSIDFLLFVFMVFQPLSGILMSKHIYTFLPSLPISTRSREIHMLFAYWGFVLMSIHGGTHLTSVLAKLKRSKKVVWRCIIFVGGFISVYGIYAFVKRGFVEYMFMKTNFAFFDYGEVVVFFFVNYVYVMILFATTGCILSNIFIKQSVKR